MSGSHAAGTALFAAVAFGCMPVLQCNSISCSLHIIAMLFGATITCWCAKLLLLGYQPIARHRHPSRPRAASAQQRLLQQCSNLQSAASGTGETHKLLCNTCTAAAGVCKCLLAGHRTAVVQLFQFTACTGTTAFVWRRHGSGQSLSKLYQ